MLSFNKNPFLNSLGYFAAVFILGFSFWSRQGLTHQIPALQYIEILSIAIVLLTLPDFFASILAKKEKWVYQQEYISIILIMTMAVVGFLFHGAEILSTYLLMPLAGILLLWNLSASLKNSGLGEWITGAIFVLLFILSYLTAPSHSPLFLERIIQGTAHIDTLFSASISGMIMNSGVPSTGMDGIPYFHYHWGSHAIFAGFTSWTGLNSLDFYIHAYPAIFIPLFIKAFFSLLRSYFRYHEVKVHSFSAGLAVLALLFSLSPAGFKFGGPALSESLNVSLIFLFFFLSVFLNYMKGRSIPGNWFIIYSGTIVLILLFTKISTGLAMVAGLGYLFIRTVKPNKQWMLVALITFSLAYLTYIFIYPTDRTEISTGIAAKIYSLWVFSDSFITYLAGLFLVFLLLLKDNPIQTLRDFSTTISSKKYLDLEFLLIVSLAGFAGAVFASSNASDVYYFSITQFYLVIALVIFLTYKYLDGFKATRNSKTGFIIAVAVFSLLSRPDLLKEKDGILQTNLIKKGNIDLSEDQLMLKSLISDLVESRNYIRNEKTCIYIPHSQTWFYHSQELYPLSTPMIVPSIAGYPLIKGIEDQVYYSGYKYYSYYYYWKDFETYSDSLEELLRQAGFKGFEKMIKYEVVNGSLKKTEFTVPRRNKK